MKLRNSILGVLVIAILVVLVITLTPGITSSIMAEGKENPAETISILIFFAFFIVVISALIIYIRISEKKERLRSPLLERSKQNVYH